ncbi:MAG: DEAD/DEAH box helicase [Gammaproteobacteria bacterium]|nr:DEAD/DEAH box helicase [Gammaproteobacteria bacterium]
MEHITKNDINSFLAESQRPHKGQSFRERLIVTTATSWSDNAQKALRGLDPPVQQIDRAALEGLSIDWQRFLDDENQPLQAIPRKRLRPHQSEALGDVLSGFEEHNRGKLIMACGTGKTLTALRIAERLVRRGGRVLYAVPSLGLMQQAIRDWTSDRELPLRAFAVCSDQTVTGAARDADYLRPTELPLPPTTDPEWLRREASRDAPDRMTVVFVTYQSMGVIRDAQRAGLPTFDLAICDEAHRTAGVTRAGDEPSPFQLIHGEAIDARKRLYMTATPRLYADAVKNRADAHSAFLASMDDEDLYGPQFHRLGFAEAVKARLLSDYKVSILAVTEQRIARLLAGGRGERTLNDVAHAIGCLHALAKSGPDHARFREQFEDDPEPMARAVAFSNSIKASEGFVGLVDELRDHHPGGLAFAAEHVDGKSGAAERRRKLGWLDEVEDVGCHILSNARCLTEGIDVPALDAVMFLEPRKSQIDVVQAVGRVMRRAEGKRVGYIILPIVVSEDTDPSSALDNDAAYAHVWQVLQALRSHDDRLDAYINQLDLNRGRDGPVTVTVLDDEGDPGAGPDPDAVEQTVLALDWGERLEDAIYARIAERCGDRGYWRDWTRDVGTIARAHETRILALLAEPSAAAVRERFEAFLAALRQNLNESITETAAAQMLAQHLVSRPVFDALFPGAQGFSALNPVSQAMEAMIAELEPHGLAAETAALEPFYESVRERAAGIDNAEGRQAVMLELYGSFFKRVAPETARDAGIVYTPTEIVDFIIRATGELLDREFDGVSLGDPGVHILDPFTGTGTFIARLVARLEPDALRRKYAGGELHANEIQLLAYYIAAANIEAAYRERAGEARPFEQLVFTDTFSLAESEPIDRDVFAHNAARAREQRELDLRVIIGNPPWARGRRGEQAYPTLDRRIAGTYVAESATMGNKNTLYDAYVRAIRWASDRVREGDGGIVGFVTNGGFLDGSSFDGFRKTVASEFHEVYVYDLRGNARTAGVTRKREGDGVFDQGSRAGVAVLLLVKRPGAVSRAATIHYHAVADYLTRDEKLLLIGAAGVTGTKWANIIPNAHGDWINQRSERFIAHRPVAAVPSEPPARTGVTALFERTSLGVKTARDTWVISSSEPRLGELVHRQAEAFNERAALLAAGDTKSIAQEPREFKWDDGARRKAKQGRYIEVLAASFRSTAYRPFFRQHVYLDPVLTDRLYRLSSIYPTPDARTPAIVVEQGLPAAGRALGVLAVDAIPDIKVAAGASGGLGHVLPRYHYAGIEDTQQTALWPDGRPGRRDNIATEALEAYRARLGPDVTADAIFGYVYAVLHAPQYRERYAADLARLLPRIPDPADRDTFDAFSEAGQKLLDLHIGYETVEPYELQEHPRALVPPEDEDDRYRVTKMRWADKGRTALHYNDWITLAGIPSEAREYVIGPRSALDWLVDRYRVTIDKPTGIVNDPNDWGLEQGNPRYILDLVKRVTTVSLETMALVRSLPALEDAGRSVRALD